MTKIKDTDYLPISTRIRAMENKLLTRERMERMLEAHTDDEAVKVLSECGYGELTELTIPPWTPCLPRPGRRCIGNCAARCPIPGWWKCFR